VPQFYWFHHFNSSTFIGKKTHTQVLVDKWSVKRPDRVEEGMLYCDGPIGNVVNPEGEALGGTHGNITKREGILLRFDHKVRPGRWAEHITG
jgi:hypothetical protein